MSITNEEKQNVLQQIDAYKDGTITGRSLFYDWFCKDHQLEKRAQKMMSHLDTIMGSPRFNAAKAYVFLKNNCPASDKPLYDDFRICDLESGDVLYTLIPKCSHSGKAELWGKDNDFDKALVQGTWANVCEYMMAAYMVIVRVDTRTTHQNYSTLAEAKAAAYAERARADVGEVWVAKVIEHLE